MKILEILPVDSTRLADETTLLVMDIVVQLEGGHVANLEVQKIGYKFPGERCACYSADLLLRQYKRVRGKMGKKFTYKDIKGVFTIVLFEGSPKEFHEFQDIYRHHARQIFDSGLKLNLLQEYVFIALDIYKEINHNKTGTRREKQFKNKLEAWLAFLCMDDAEVVIQLIEQYPEFKPMYEEAYQLCLNTEEVMQMFSKELAELDRNTVQLMIDEMQDEINAKKKELQEMIELKGQLVRKVDEAIDSRNRMLAERDEVIDSRNKIIAERDEAIDSRNKIIAERDEVIDSRNKIIAERDEAIKSKDKTIWEKDEVIKEKDGKMQEMIRTVYQKVKDIDKVSELTGCSRDEIESAIR